MQVVYTGEDAPTSYKKSIFLVGPTPRNQSVQSWRPAMLQTLKNAGYDGVVFSPEWRSGIFSNSYEEQVSWEQKHLRMADLIVAWVPRELNHMPAFTTNVEFGTYLDSGKLVYGRPDNSPKNTYLDWLYQDRELGPIHNSMESITQEVVNRLGDGCYRMDGERYIPLDIWKMPAFSKWYSSQLNAGNRLDEARLLWSFNIRNKPFCYALWAKMWIISEGRYKENEFVFGRSDISTIFAFMLNPNKIEDSQVLLVKEFRVPGRTLDGFIHELPGGSSFQDNEDPCEVAAHELEEETGVKVEVERFHYYQSRQLAGTLSSHQAHLYVVKLTPEEMKQAIDKANSKKTFGIVGDSECTYVEVKTLSEIVKSQEVDWSNLGMILAGILTAK